MAIKAFVIPLAVAPSPLDNNKICLQVNGTVLGNDIGTLTNAEFSFLIENLDPPSLAVLKVSIETAVKTKLESNGVTFQVGDTVLVY